MTDDDLKRGAELMRALVKARSKYEAIVALFDPRAAMHCSTEELEIANDMMLRWLIEHGEALFKRAEGRK